jgi:tetratricopeptide (TPR) repeat protein
MLMRHRLTSLRNRHSLLAGLLLLITLIAYIPAIQGGFVWDDDRYVTENQSLGSLQGLKKIWINPSSTPQYYPLVFSTFWLEYRLWGLRPTGYHLVNVLLHAVSALLLYRLLLYLNLPGAWLAAAVFALHPVQVESVAWVTERKNVLSGFFYFASAFCLFRFFGIAGAREKKSGLWWYCSGLLLFACALLSKTVTCTLPAAMLLVLWWKRDRLRGREVAALAPFFALGLVMGLATVWLEQHQVGAMGPEWNLSLGERFLIAGRALWFYVGKLIWPAELIFNYPRWQVDAGVWWQYIYPAGVLFVLLFLWIIRDRVGSGPLVGLLFFCGTLFPALGFFDVYPFQYSYVADHFQYLASVGLIALLIGVIATAASKLPERPGRITSSLGLIVLLVLGVQTWRQGYVYRDGETLWHDTLKKNPESWMAHNNLGIFLTEQGKLQEGIDHYSEALRIKPDHAKAHYNLGNALASQGRFEEAIDHYLEALRIKPDYASAHNNLALALMKQGKVQEAIDHFYQVVQIVPDRAEAHYNLAVALAENGRIDEAIDHYYEALRIEPNNTIAHIQLALIWLAQERTDKAIEHYNKALSLSPDSTLVLNNLAWILATYRNSSFRDGARAVQLAEKACTLSGYKDPVFLDTLAAAYAEAGRFHEALQTAQKAVEFALAEGRVQLAGDIKKRIQLYKAGKVFYAS